MDDTAAAALLQARIDELAHLTDEPGRITRTFLSPAMRRANDLVARWMRDAGFSTWTDSAGNLRGWMDGPAPDSPVLLTGSHLDTVRNAGRYDGPLGVLLPIVAIERLRAEGWRPPFAILNFGFADEEGVRFQAGCLGSKAALGRLTEADLQLRDHDGMTLRQALEGAGGAPWQPSPMPALRALGYVETHIEQGPELERIGKSVAVVTGINAQNRIRVRFIGEAGHAGTVSMTARRDAFAGLAEFACFSERLAKSVRGLVVTIGSVELQPGAGNVIPGLADFSVDARHPSDATLESACLSLRREAGRICEARGLECEWRTVDAMAAVEFGQRLTDALGGAVLATGHPIVRLSSGAGHDAMVMAQYCEAAMLFVRCRRGLSHHPDEYVSSYDLERALRVFCEFLKRLRP
jgi:hydantoinase/carbamoylase family amidase